VALVADGARLTTSGLRANQTVQSYFASRFEVLWWPLRIRRSCRNLNNVMNSNWTEEPRKNSMNPSYHAYKGNHCADFVSQALNAGGWNRTGGMNPYLDGNWDDDLFGPAGPSRAWAQAKSLYRYAYDKKRLSWMDNIWNAQPGDLYFVDWDNDGDTAIDHVVAVTGRTNGVPRISSKTNNRHNMLLGTWRMKIAEQRGPNSIWYGLRNQVR